MQIFPHASGQLRLPKSVQTVYGTPCVHDLSGTDELTPNVLLCMIGWNLRNPGRLESLGSRLKLHTLSFLNLSHKKASGTGAQRVSSAKSFRPRGALWGQHTYFSESAATDTLSPYSARTRLQVTGAPSGIMIPEVLCPLAFSGAGNDPASRFDRQSAAHADGVCSTGQRNPLTEETR